jgi:hypothetical protein
LEDRGVDRRMGLEWILERGAGGGGVVEWIQLAQRKNRQQGYPECGDETSGSGATELGN